jgi:26S proteasome regulatory subunit N10
MSLAGKVPRVIVTPTDDLGQVLNAVHGISTGGSINLSTGVQVRLVRKINVRLQTRRNVRGNLRATSFLNPADLCFP